MLHIQLFVKHKIFANFGRSIYQKDFNKLFPFVLFDFKLELEAGITKFAISNIDCFDHQISLYLLLVLI